MKFTKEIEGHRSPTETDKVTRERIGELSGKQARIALLGVLQDVMKGNYAEEALQEAMNIAED